MEHTKTERNVLGYINHPYIVGLTMAFQTADKLFFVLDYCSGGELFFHLGNVSRFRRTYFVSITHNHLIYSSQYPYVPTRQCAILFYCLIFCLIALSYDVKVFGVYFYLSCVFRREDSQRRELGSTPRK